MGFLSNILWLFILDCSLIEGANPKAFQKGFEILNSSLLNFKHEFLHEMVSMYGLLWIQCNAMDL